MWRVAQPRAEADENTKQKLWEMPHLQVTHREAAVQS